MKAGTHSPRWDGPTVMLLVVGLVPILGLALLGHWPDWEVGAGTAVTVFALRELLR